jgi:hypothetical protein
MKVKELIEMLEGKEDYTIEFDCYNSAEMQIDSDSKLVTLVLVDDDEEDNYEEDEENEDCDFEDEDFEEPELEEYLQDLDTDDLILLAEKLNISIDNSEVISDEELIKEILKFDEDEIEDICEDLFDYSYDDFKADYEMNNAWRYSDYENKDIDDWSVDDHLAAWYDHMMEK